MDGQYWENAWSLKQNRPKRYLLGSKTFVAAAMKVPLRTFQRRVQRGNMGYSKAKLRGGKCQYCRQFDVVEEPLVLSVFEKLRGSLEELSPNFWDLWDRYKADCPAFNEDNFREAASPKFQQDLIDYCTSHAKTLKNNAKECSDLVKAFSDTYKKDGGIYEIVKAFSAHFTLWRNQEDVFKRHWQEPLEGILHAAADFADRCAQFYLLSRAAINCGVFTLYTTDTTQTNTNRDR